MFEESGYGWDSVNQPEHKLYAFVGVRWSGAAALALPP